MADGLGFGKRRLVNKIIMENWQVKTPEEKIFKYNELLFLLQELFSEEGKPYNEPRVMVRGHRIFRAFVSHMLYRNLANYDSMVLLTSEKGTGKSSAAIMLARQWCKLLGIKFDPKRHIAYNNADVMNKIDNLNPFEPLICDEAIRFASSCIVGDTLIKTEKGLFPIEQLKDKSNFKVYSLNEKTKKEELQVAEKCVKVKDDIVFEIELENGNKIQATKEHRFLTTNGWKRLEELKTEDDLIGI